MDLEAMEIRICVGDKMKDSVCYLEHIPTEWFFFCNDSIELSWTVLAYLVESSNVITLASSVDTKIYKNDQKCTFTTDISCGAERKHSGMHFGEMQSMPELAFGVICQRAEKVIEPKAWWCYK